MKITELLEKLSLVDRNLPVKCRITSDGVGSNICVVGQVRPSFPGVRLGDREPYLREKVAGGFIDELKTFGDEFQDKEFLLESTLESNKGYYEVRYFPLTLVEVAKSEVTLTSCVGELVGFREQHDDCEK